MSETLSIDLSEETKAALEDATREEGVSTNELVDLAIKKIICSSGGLGIFESG